MWSFIIDGIVIGIIVVFAVIGVIKGLIDSVLSLLGTAIAVVVGVFTAKYVSGLINKIFNLETSILNTMDGGEAGTFKIFGNEFSNPDIARFAVWLISVVAVFLLTKLILLILSKMFEKVTQNAPVISGINRTLGAVFGVVKGAVMVAVSLALCSALSQLPFIGTTISDKIAETKVTNFAYKYVDEFVETQLTKENIENLISNMVPDKDA